MDAGEEMSDAPHPPAEVVRRAGAQRKLVRKRENNPGSRPGQAPGSSPGQALTQKAKGLGVRGADSGSTMSKSGLEHTMNATECQHWRVGARCARPRAVRDSADRGGGDTGARSAPLPVAGGGGSR
jgi:hypothetical protein